MSEPQSTEALVDALCYGEVILPGMDEEFFQLVARINLVCVASPDLDYPSLDECGLRRFFRFAVAGKGQPEQVDARRALEEFVGSVKLGWLDEIVPRQWRLENGVRVDLEYSPETNPKEGTAFSPTGELPVSGLEGTRDHPFVCEGRVAVRLRLTDERGLRLGETLDWPSYSASLKSRSSR